MLCVVFRGDVSVVIVNEVCVVWQPADSEYNQNYDEHNAHLKIIILFLDTKYHTVGGEKSVLHCSNPDQLWDWFMDQLF